ncbi:hypothetical protein Cgig2_019787 [Carnegiea gigantea]|uniref:Zinc finger GRF-type domain-containing protein n=1 Tax=Carnegiea gigantea TaxID=171969 RepID=A0A9Q1KE29_9CARY|nr:hypothetical protein Cgig2_019787 [Carnegiea gigantea]
MEGFSSSRSKLASEDIAVYQRCNCEGVQKVSHSSQNPGRSYFKCLRCDKFLKWVANEGPQERPMVVDVDIVKKELMEMRLMLKSIEKGQTLIVILLIVVIVLIAMVVVFLFFLYLSNSRPLSALGLPQVKLVLKRQTLFCYAFLPFLFFSAQLVDQV